MTSTETNPPAPAAEAAPAAPEASAPDAAVFARVGRGLLSDPDLPVTLERVVGRGLEVVPGATMCSVSLRGRRGTATTAASTHQTATDLDDRQYSFGEGPCLETLLGDAGTLASRDLEHELRWPRWSRTAAEAGVRSVLAVRLQAADPGGGSGLVTGALNLYADEPDAFDANAVDVAEIYAEHAAAALDQAREVTGLRTALESRHRIGMAQGVLALRYDIGYEGAFEAMRRIASDTNTRLRDLAEQVLHRRELPEGSRAAGPSSTGAIDA